MKCEFLIHSMKNMHNNLIIRLMVWQLEKVLSIYRAHLCSSGSRILVQGRNFKQNFILHFSKVLYCNGIGKISMGKISEKMFTLMTWKIFNIL